MTDTPNPPAGGDNPPGAGRRYWIDEHGNVHGVVMTMEVDHCVEFTDKAVPLTGQPDEPGKPKPDA